MGKKILQTISGIIIIYSALAFAIKAGLGVLPVDAATTTIADIIHIKIGTFSMLFHSCFIVGQILIEKKSFRKTELLQIPYVIFGGSILNFILYTVLEKVTITFYLLRLLVAVLAFIVSAFGVAMVLESNLMRTPMEGFLQLVADKIGMAAGRLRQFIDIGLVVISVVLTLIFHTAWTLREGTIIAALIFGPAIDLWRNLLFRKK